MDLLPTIAALVGADLPDRRIDGRDLSSMLTGGAAPDGEPVFVYYEAHGDLAGVRRGRWKLLLVGPRLFDVERDVSETKDVAESRPELVRELTALARSLDAQIEASARPRGTSQTLAFDPARR
jgi:arylsulfatase A-like enzyme